MRMVGMHAHQFLQVSRVLEVKDNGAQGGAIEGTVWKKQMLHPPECIYHVLEALRPWKVDFVTDNVLRSGSG